MLSVKKALLELNSSKLVRHFSYTTLFKTKTWYCTFFQNLHRKLDEKQLLYLFKIQLKALFEKF